MKKLTLICLVAALVIAPTAAQAPVITPENGSQIVEIMRLGRATTDRAAFSPDGQTIAVASTVGVWLYAANDVATALEPPLLNTVKIAKGIAFAPDGQTLAVATDADIQFWDYINQTLTTSVPLNRSSTSIAYSPDGTLLAINQGYNGIVLWDIAANVEKTRIEGSIQSDAAIVFSPDGALLAGSTTDYKAHLWRVSDGTEAAVFGGHTRYVYDFVFISGGIVAVSASYDKTIRLWDIASGTELGMLAGTEAQPLGEVYSLALSPDGETLVSGHANGQIVVWDVDIEVPEIVFGPQTGQIVDLAFSPDGKQIVSVSSEHTLQLWDIDGTELAAAVGHTHYISAVTFSPDSAILAVSDWDKNVWLWDVNAMQQINFTVPAANMAYSGLRNDTMLDYAPDNSLLATTDGFDIFLLDPVSGAEIRRLTDCPGTMASFVFSPDSTLLAQASSNGLCLFDVASGSLLVSIASPDWLNTVAFSPDQTMIATAGKDHTARVYALP